MAKAATPRFPRLTRFLEWLGATWNLLRQWGLALRPMRFSLLMVAAGAIFLIVDQGLDTIRYFAEYQASNGQVSVQAAFFLAGTFLWVFGAWYWARVMTYIAFRPAPEPVAGVRLIQTWGPRAAGLVAIFSLALAFHRAGLSYDDTSKGAGAILRYYLYATLAGGVVFFIFVLTRRRFVAPWLGERMRRYRRTAAAGRSLKRIKTEEQEKFNSVRISRLPRATWIWLAIPGVVAVVLFFLFAFWPARTAPVFGTAAILLMAAAGWIAYGSAADMFGMHHRFPFFLVLFGLAVLFSFWNDNHAVRTLDQPAAKPWDERDDLKVALREWMKKQVELPTTRADTTLPLYLVAAEGGGIRAAYWTANVLTAIQDSNPRFADQLFVLSGVSGGSLGSAVFTALLAEKRSAPASPPCKGQHKTLNKCAKDILGADFLAPAVAGTLYPDLVQRILPVGIERFDRARALESAWELSWRDHTGSNRFAEPLDNLWKDIDGRWLPQLLLNATWVETGKRLITSNMRVLPRNSGDPVEFADVEDTHRFYNTRALPLSTAVHLSARFTYISPAGSITRENEIHGRAVDGGYFENSGTTAVLEILDTIEAMPDIDPQWKRVRPYVILISNEPVDLRPKRRDISLEAGRTNKIIRPLPGGNEVLSPWLTLLNTREARGSFAKVTTYWHLKEDQFLHFGLCRNDQVKIPLGWVLSQAARKAMDDQLSRNACGELFPNKANLDAIEKVLKNRVTSR